MIMMRTLLLLTLLVGVSLGEGKVPRNCRYNVHKDKGCPEIEDIGMEDHDNIERCMDRCDTMDNCMGFLRSDEDKYCKYMPLKCNVRDLGSSTHMFYTKPRGVYKVEPLTDCSENNIIPAFHRTLAAGCMKVCDVTLGCVAFFRNSTGYCFIKDKCNERQAVTIGDLYLNPFGQFQYLPNNNCEDNNIKPDPETDFHTCMQKCVEMKECVGVVSIGRFCWMKSQCTNIVVDGDADIHLAPDCIDGFRADIDCGLVGGHCRPNRCKRGKERPCQGQAKCETGKGKACCCTIWSPRECKKKGGVCKSIGRCGNDEVASGTCNKQEVCCSKRD